MDNNSPQTLIIGDIKRDYIITEENRAFNNRLGGSAIACASGAGLWKQESAVISTVNKNFSYDLFNSLNNKGINFDGVSISSANIEHRQFSFFKSPTQVVHNDPAKYYLDSNLDYPKELLGLKQSFNNVPHSIFQDMKLPESIHSISASHICPLPYEDQIRIPFILREKGVPTITLKPSTNYLQQISLSKIPQLISNLTAFLPSKEDLFTLYPLLRFDIWSILSQFENQGCKFIVVPSKQDDTYLYDLESKRKYKIPAYPVRIKNLIGIEDAFCGGFLAGYQKTFNPVEAARFGIISASFAMSGYTATYALDTLPSLAKARLDILREEIRLV